MNKPITVKQLKNLCEQEIKKGNGDKVIMISDDDEGNGYHYLWYSFTDFKEILDYACSSQFDERIASEDDTIILG